MMLCKFLPVLAMVMFSTISSNAINFSSPPDTIIQDYHLSDNIKPSKNQGLIRLQLTDFRKNPLGHIPVFVHNGKGQYWQGITDTGGEAIFLLPNQARYLVNVEGEVDYRKFSIPKEKNYSKRVKVVLMTTKIHEQEQQDTIYQTGSAGLMPTRSRVLVNIIIKDLNEFPLAGEAFSFNGKKSGKVYMIKTDRKGQAQLLLPKGDEYCVQSYAYKNITCKTYEQQDHSRTSTFKLNMISTEEFKTRAAERQLLLARRDSLQRERRIQDSIQLVRNASKNFYLQYHYKKRDYQFIENRIKELVLMDQKSLSVNPNFFVEAGEEIRAILERHKTQWQQKRIVANIDCSMYSYIDELLVWNFHDPAAAGKNKYWFFNGFNYLDAEADGHSRRGIFPVEQNNVAGFFKTIDQIVNFSCRGSRLENVVEALILGANGQTKQEDLVFIADNYSDVADLEKLDGLHVPVHVLLTGSEYGINENYLEIAYHSGGSIHTLREDIPKTRLEALKDGDHLRIGDFAYRFFKGRFLKV